MSEQTQITAKTPSPQITPKTSVLLQRKCACGGSSGFTGSCPDCEKKKLLGQPLQTKLRVNEPGDQYEQEADRVAEQVMRMAAPAADRESAKTATAPLVQRRVNGNGAGIGAAPAVVHEVLSSPGQPLDAATRAFFEPRFRHEFGNVRVHRDGQAQQYAKSIHARAFTIGRNIAFGTGEYFPGASSSRRLLAHELTHVLQQHYAWASTPLDPIANRFQPGRDATPSALMIQRTEGPDDPESAADEAPPSTWTISEQPGAGVIRDSDRGFAPARNRQPIPPGTIVSPLDYREVSGISYAWVEWSGGIDWVLRSDLLEFDYTYATPRGEDVYRQNVKSFPENQALTTHQMVLLERAMKFTDDGSIQTPKELDELGLDSELVTRLKTFYRFLVQEDLITDQKFPMSGSRKPWVAHELSTKWMLNKKNNVLRVAVNRIEFAKLLVEINGKDGVTDTIWATKEQVEKLSQALDKIRAAKADTEIAKWGLIMGASSPLELYADPKVEAILRSYQLSFVSLGLETRGWPNPKRPFREFLLQRQTEIAEEVRIREHSLTIDAVVAEIRDHFSQKEQKPQAAPALEGYPKGAPERYPNIMDVEMTHHLTGDAADIHFPYKFYYFDPIIDALAEVFGLSRVALTGAHGEYWHYQATGKPLGGTQPAEEPRAE